MRRYLLVGFPALGVAGVVFFIALAVPWLLRHQPYMSPEQPIAFSHRIHVQQAGLDCAFCHRTAADSSTAGYPDVEQCMFCHQVVGPGEAGPTNRAGQQEIQKVREAWIEQRPVEWVRVHRMPDHTHFVHDAHIRAGVSCAVCHGNVGSMTQAVKVRPLNMSDCVNCHQQTGAPTDCATCHF
ncbi:MAG: cytochrome c3 family protein [Chloroflexota bacterium]